MKKHLHKIAWVEPGSIAEELGLEPGDAIEEINGNEIEDIFDYQYYVEDEYLDVLILTKDINIIQVPQHHRAGRRRSNRVIGAVASIAIPCNQIICDAVAHIAFCPFRNIRKAAKAAVKGAVRFKLLGICDNSGEQRRHLRPCQPLLQHHVARLVAQHNAGFTQIGGSRLLRTFFGGKRSYC